MHQPDQTVRNNFTFISDKGNKCFVEFTDDPELCRIINLDDKSAEPIDIHWKKAIGILDNKQKAQRIKQKNKSNKYFKDKKKPMAVHLTFNLK